MKTGSHKWLHSAVNLGLPALRVQDTQRAWKAACVPRGCSGSTRVKGLEPFLINFLMHRSPPGDTAGSITEREVGDPHISSMASLHLSTLRADCVLSAPGAHGKQLALSLVATSVKWV